MYKGKGFHTMLCASNIINLVKGHDNLMKPLTPDFFTFVTTKSVDYKSFGLFMLIVLYFIFKTTKNIFKLNETY